MQMTLTQAGELYGKPRSTFHRAIKAGRLSCTVQADGSRRIDFAELLRVYGEPPHPQHVPQQAVAPQLEPDATRNDALLEVMRSVLEENRAMRQEMVAMRSELAAIKEQRLLPAPPQKSLNETAGGAQEESGTLARDEADPHGLRALARRLGG